MNRRALNCTEYRQARKSDLVQVADLLNRYYVGNLDSVEQRNGFLSAQFSVEQLVLMNSDVGIVVCLVDDVLAGCLCGMSATSNALPPPARAMVTYLPSWSLHGERFDEARTLVYGPVCIDHSFRGRGILAGLFEQLLTLARGRFDRGIAFIMNSNPNSMAAHIDGLGMTFIGEFMFSSEPLSTLAFDVP